MTTTVHTATGSTGTGGHPTDPDGLVHGTTRIARHPLGDGEALITHIGHDPATQIAVLQFKGGRVYGYAGVSAALLAALLEAPALGEFVNAHIKKLATGATRPYRELTGADIGPLVQGCIA